MKLLKNFLLLVGISFLVVKSYSQSIGIGTTTPDSSALLELNSTTKGFLIPRMSEVQRNNIINPAEGLVVYQNNLDTGFYYFSGTNWRKLLSNQQVTNSGLSQGFIVFIKKSENPDEVWISRLDGSSAFKVPIPDSIRVGDDAGLSLDGQLVFFGGYPSEGTNRKNIYSCFLDGSNLRRVINSTMDYGFEIRATSGGYTLP